MPAVSAGAALQLGGDFPHRTLNRSEYRVYVPTVLRLEVILPSAGAQLMLKRCDRKSALRLPTSL